MTTEIGVSTTPRDAGFVLLAVMWLMAGLSLLLLGSSAQLLDALQLAQDRQQVVLTQVELENDWQCQWWHWQQQPVSFPQPHSACGTAHMQLQQSKLPPLCASINGEECHGMWVTLTRTRGQHCRQLHQFVLQRSRLKDDQSVDVRLWRGERYWQSCAVVSS